MKRSPKVDEAVRLVREEGWSQAEAARHCGVTPTAVWKRLNPGKAREYNRKQEARPERKVAKREWDREHDWSLCPECGKRMGVGSHHKGTARCQDCHVARERASHADRDRQIEAWWAEGLLLREIGQRLDWTEGHVSVEIHRLRERGYQLPYRYRPGKRNATRFPAQVAA